MNLALIGPRGAGKTRIAQLLAQHFKWPVFTVDALICYEADGKSIPELLAEHDGNWTDFREREYAVLAKVTRLDQVIIDCGGGIVVDMDGAGQEVLSERKTELLRAHALVFFLHPPLADVAAKIGGDNKRPLLPGGDNPEQVYQRRLPMYRDTAHHEIAITKKRRERAAKRIIKLVSDARR